MLTFRGAQAGELAVALAGRLGETAGAAAAEQWLPRLLHAVNSQPDGERNTTMAEVVCVMVSALRALS